MRVLITGGAGFIGSYLVDRFLSEAWNVRVLDVLDPQVHPNGCPKYLASGTELMIADIRDRQRVAEALEGVDAVVHAAAAVGVAQSLYRIEHYVDVNVRGTATLLECLEARRRQLRKLVILTSNTGYGEGVYRRPSDGLRLRVAIRREAHIRQSGWEPCCSETGEVLESVPTPEDAALMARNIYALTKRSQEDLGLSLAEIYGLPVVCLRMFNVYGPRQALGNPYTGVLAIFLSRLIAGESPVVYEDGAQTRDFISVHDVVDAVIAAIESPAANDTVINIGTGVPRRIGDVARALAHAAGVPHITPVITGRFRRGDIRHCTADVSRARRLLGFEPKVTWEQGLEELVRWCRGAPSADRFALADEELRVRGLTTERIERGT